MRLESAAVLFNPRKPSARKLKGEIEAFLRARGVSIRRPSQAQILITISGDGTILFLKNTYTQPVLAIGSLTSQLCQTRYEHWRRDMTAVVERGFTLERRTMLQATMNGQPIPPALNEVVVRNRHHRLLHLELTVGRTTHRFRADGIIFSTATGSRAYSYSAGGKKLPLRSKRWQVVAIAPHQREFKKLLLPTNAKARFLERTGRSRAPGKDGMGMPTKPDVVVDGQFVRPLPRGSVIEVQRAKREMLFVKIRKKRD